MKANQKFKCLHTNLSEITAQVWSNIQANCDLSQTLVVHPSLNVTGPGPDTNETLTWNAQPTCDQTLQNHEVANSSTTCQAFALEHNIPSASLIDMINLGNGTFCAPSPCTVDTTNYTMGVSTYQYLAKQQPNITLTQFMTWNPYSRFNSLKWGDVVCIG